VVLSFVQADAPDIVIAMATIVRQTGKVEGQFMQYRRLGRSGLKVSEICLGTMTFGHGTDQVEAEHIVLSSLDAGVTFFDTADGYSDGASETMLGHALGARRREAVIATKVFNAMGSGPNDSGMSRVHIMNAVEDSLRRLGTDYIDLYYIHHVDVQTPLEEMLRAFDDLVRQGKIRYPACSNYEAWRLMEALWISDSKGFVRFEAYQPQYSLVVRDIEEELVPVCALKELGMVVWSPLAGGYLSGKYKPGDRTVAGSRSAENWAFPARFFHLDHEAILAELLAVARDLGRSPAAIHVRWKKPWRAGVTRLCACQSVRIDWDKGHAGNFASPDDRRQPQHQCSARG
jgi:aryl-alcohol dehydrogenase-like predicted oxidoreductase